MEHQEQKHAGERDASTRSENILFCFSCFYRTFLLKDLCVASSCDKCCVRPAQKCYQPRRALILVSLRIFCGWKQPRAKQLSTPPPALRVALRSKWTQLSCFTPKRTQLGCFTPGVVDCCGRLGWHTAAVLLLAQFYSITGTARERFAHVRGFRRCTWTTMAWCSTCLGISVRTRGLSLHRFCWGRTQGRDRLGCGDRWRHSGGGEARVRKAPAQNGSVGGNADDECLVGCDLDSANGSAVTKSNVRHLSRLVVPHLQQEFSLVARILNSARWSKTSPANVQIERTNASCLLCQGYGKNQRCMGASPWQSCRPRRWRRSARRSRCPSCWWIRLGIRRARGSWTRRTPPSRRSCGRYRRWGSGARPGGSTRTWRACWRASSASDTAS